MGNVRRHTGTILKEILFTTIDNDNKKVIQCQVRKIIADIFRISRSEIVIINLVKVIYCKLRWPSHFKFHWKRCWQIRIRKGFEITQFNLPGKFEVHLGRGVMIEKDVWLSRKERA